MRLTTWKAARTTSPLTSSSNVRKDIGGQYISEVKNFLNFKMKLDTNMLIKSLTGYAMSVGRAGEILTNF